MDCLKNTFRYTSAISKELDNSEVRYTRWLYRGMPQVVFWQPSLQGNVKYAPEE